MPNNGCFDDKSIHEFQKGLLWKELSKARQDLKLAQDKLELKRQAIKNNISQVLLPSIIFHSRIANRKVRKDVKSTHESKLLKLSEEQERPLFSVDNTVRLLELDRTPPTYVMETLSLGLKNAIIDKFQPKDILAELDVLLSYCKDNNVDRDIMTDINIRTFNYVKKCKKQKASRNIAMTKRYLEDNDLLAVPFDKGIGICVMKKEAYNTKLSAILDLPQLEKMISARKDAMHPVFKEQQRVVENLKELKRNGKIDKERYNRLRPTGSQPARLYGLAKVHKNNTPVRPVLSMPGSAYHKIAQQLTGWLQVVPECRINSSTKSISDSLRDITLQNDEELVSFDVTSFYTNVPVEEAIQVCADLLYSGTHLLPPVDKETFTHLLQISTCNVLMLTHDGYYKQLEGLAMGSPPAPLLANGWSIRCNDPRRFEIICQVHGWHCNRDKTEKHLPKVRRNQQLASIPEFHNWEGIRSHITVPRYVADERQYENNVYMVQQTNGYWVNWHLRDISAQ